jgi:hypothetical protein
VGKAGAGQPDYHSPGESVWSGQAWDQLFKTHTDGGMPFMNDSRHIYP